MYKTAVLAVLATAAMAFQPDAVHPLIARQSNSSYGIEGDIPPGCLSATNLIETIPTPPPEIRDPSLMEGMTDPCNFVPPATVAEAFSSYGLALSSWYNVYSSDLDNLASNCPPYASLTDGAAIGVCTGAVADSSVTGGSEVQNTVTETGRSVAAAETVSTGIRAAPTPSASASGSGNGTSDASGDNASAASVFAQPLGLTAVMMAAGFLGVAVML